MLFFGKKHADATNQGADGGDLKSIAESLYKQNFEIVTKNKTLSLLSKLYEISILTLQPPALCKKISETIQVDFDFEFVGIMSYDRKNDKLSSLATARSERFYFDLSVKKVSLDNVAITNVASVPFLAQVITQKAPGYSLAVADVFGSALSQDKLTALQASKNVASILVYPLVIEGQTIGIFVMILNRAYDSLSASEKESIHSLINVTAVALDKALVYEQLKISNKKLESANKELERLDQAKSEFLSIASHQLRTPLTVIKGYTSMVQEGSFGKVPVKIAGILDKVFISTERLISLVESLLNISRIEAGRIEFDMQPVDLTEVIKLLVADFQQKAAAKGLVLEFTPEKNVPAASTDPQKVKEVISNLLDNAIKYTEKGSINVGLHPESQSIVFTSQDTGLGIEPEDLPRLFNKFVRGKGMQQVHTEGTGLGLYFARMVVEQMGGRIWAESEGKGKGSKFSFSLPMADKSKVVKIK